MKGQYRRVMFRLDNEAFEIVLSVCEKTAWLSSKQIGLLFGVSASRLAYHVKTILREKTLDKTVVKEETGNKVDGRKYRRKVYNLEMVKEIGRRLDFMAQEMNREANTTLSKANDIEISNIAIELKTEIEKIREQIQNIE